MNVLTVLVLVVLAACALCLWVARSSRPALPPPSVYRGRSLVSPILQQRHGLRADEERQWSANEVLQHCSADDLWLIVDGRVYDVTDFASEHPGGLQALMRSPGRDNSAAFHGPQHPDKVQQMIGEYYIGTVRAEQEQLAAARGAAVLSDGEPSQPSQPLLQEAEAAAHKRRRSRKD